MAEEFVAAMEEAWLGGEGGNKAVALVGDAGSALSIRLVGVLDCGGFASDESVLTVVDGVGVGIGKTEVRSVRHAAVDGESRAVVDAGGGALEFVNFAELGDGTSERIDARGKCAGRRLRVLPGGEGIDGVVAVLKYRAGGIEDGISERDRLRKVDIESADEMFAVDVKIGDSDSGVAGNLALEGEAGLLDARRDKVRSER